MGYRIWWDAGWGRMEEEIDAINLEQARNFAYDAAKEEFDNNVDYGAEEIAPEEDEE